MAVIDGEEHHSDQTTLRECASPQRPATALASEASTPSGNASWVKKTWLNVKVTPRQLKNIIKYVRLIMETNRS